MQRRSKSALDDPARARVAWARYRRMMGWMALVTVAVLIVALLYLGSGGGKLHLNEVIATVIGVTLTMMVGTGLMLLVFLSNGTGHDDEVQAKIDEQGW